MKKQSQDIQPPLQKQQQGWRCSISRMTTLWRERREQGCTIFANKLWQSLPVMLLIKAKVWQFLSPLRQLPCRFEWDSWPEFHATHCMKKCTILRCLLTGAVQQLSSLSKYLIPCSLYAVHMPRQLHCSNPRTNPINICKTYVGSWPNEHLKDSEQELYRSLGQYPNFGKF